MVKEYWQVSAYLRFIDIAVKWALLLLKKRD